MQNVYSPITSAVVTVYTTHQQQRQEAQRLCQREYHGQQAAKEMGAIQQRFVFSSHTQVIYLLT